MLVSGYRRFGTIERSHSQGSSSPKIMPEPENVCVCVCRGRCEWYLVHRDIEGIKPGAKVLKIFFPITMQAIATALFRAPATRFVTLPSLSPLTPNPVYLHTYIVFLSILLDFFDLKNGTFRLSRNDGEAITNRPHTTPQKTVLIFPVLDHPTFGVQ